MKNKRKSTLKKMNILKLLKLLGIVFKVSIIIICVYAVVNRIQDVKGVEFFFTTWVK